MTAINVISMSNAADLGYRALADVAAASEGIPLADYRIVGGHMVQMLMQVYPTPRQRNEARPMRMLESERPWQLGKTCTTSSWHAGMRP